MSSGMVHGGSQQQMMWQEHQQQAYGGTPVGLAAWVDAHAFPVPPPQENDVGGQEEGTHVFRKVAALEVENCEMAGKMAGMEALLREREMEATEMKQQLLAYEHVLEGERRGEPLSKAELLKQVIALSAQLQELTKQKPSSSGPPPAIVGQEDPSASGQDLPPLPPPPGAAAPAAPAPAQAPAAASAAPKSAPSHAAPPTAPVAQPPPPEEFIDPGDPVDQFEGSPHDGSRREEELQLQAPPAPGARTVVPGYVAPPPVRLGKNPEVQGFQPQLTPVQLQQTMSQMGMAHSQGQGQGQWGSEGYQQPMQQPMARPSSRGEMRIPASPRAGAMVPASPRIGGPVVPASPRLGGYTSRVPQSPRISYNRVPQSPRMSMGGPMVPQSPRVAPSPYAQVPYFNDRPMTSPSPMMNRAPSMGANMGYAGSGTTPLGHSASFGGSALAPSASFGGAAMAHSASFSPGMGGGAPMTPSHANAGASGVFQGHNLPNMNAAEMYGGDITASGLSAVRGSLLTFQRAKNLQAKESVLRHLDSMVEHGRVSPDEVVAGVMEKCSERMRVVPPPPRQTGGLLSNLAGKTKLKAAEDEFLKNAAVAEVGMLASTVVAFEWAPSSSFIELLETVPDLLVRRLLTLEFLNGVFGRCGKLAVAKVINELSYLDTLVGDGILPSVKELSNCMVLVMVNTKRSVEWRRKWVLGKA